MPNIEAIWLRGSATPDYIDSDLDIPEITVLAKINGKWHILMAVINDGNVFSVISGETDIEKAPIDSLDKDHWERDCCQTGET